MDANNIFYFHILQCCLVKNNLTYYPTDFLQETSLFRVDSPEMVGSRLTYKYWVSTERPIKDKHSGLFFRDKDKH